jgi:hypothetical protein
VQKKNKNWFLIILAAIILVTLSIRIISPWTVTNLDNEGVKAVIYNHYDEESPNWPKAEEETDNHNITIEQILAKEVIENGTLLVFYHNNQNGNDSIKYAHITRPMFKWIVDSYWIYPLELMLEREPISVSVGDTPNVFLVYGFINDPRVERVLVGSERSSFDDAAFTSVELADGRTVILYYLVASDNDVIVLDSDNNVMWLCT